MKNQSFMKKHISYRLALILTAVLGTSPVLSFAAGPNYSKLTTPPKSEKPVFISKLAKPNRVPRTQTQMQLEGQTTTLLPDGRTLLIGGEGSAGPQSTVFISDPKTRESTPLSHGLYQARAWHSATMLPNGKVLVLGGVGGKGKVISDVEIFDPETGTSEPLHSAGLTARAYHSATLLTDGRVLIVGGLLEEGRTVAGAELWNLKTKKAVSWEGKLSAARRLQKATILSDGNVLIEGGIDDNGRELRTSELFNVEVGSFSFTSISLDHDQDKVARLAASLPQDGTTEAPIDVRIALRFSKELRVESINPETVKLSDHEGTVQAKLVTAEKGRLIFITPAESLRASTTYTVSVENVSDGTNAMPPIAISFTTIGDKRTEDPPNSQSLGDSGWTPDAQNLRGDWSTKFEKSNWQDQPALQASPGETAVSGQVLTLRGQPLADVTLTINGNTAHTDLTGRFLITSLSAGHQVMVVDGRSASKPGGVYGLFRVGLDVTTNQTNVLPYTIWMPKLDMAHATTIPSPNNQEIVITNPLIPGLELHLPAGTVIRDLDGQAVTQISITPVPTDRPPFPLPPGFKVPVFASIQPGGARIIPPRARLIYPNYTNERAGARINFWNYDPEAKGWYIYGQGTVSANGKQIIPDAGVVIYEFTGIMISGGGSPAGSGPKSGNGPGSQCCDPVDLSTGLFVLTNTDLAVADVLPLTLRRTYRPEDNVSRAFGIGATHPYEMFLWSVNNYQELDLILADGGRIHYVRVSPGTGFTDAVYEHTSTPSAFYKSRISWDSGNWILKLKDGTVYVFPEYSPVQLIRDRFGNQITITRAGGTSGNITQISSPNGRWIQFTYDTSNRITQAKDNSGRTVNYTYDAGGRLWKVTDPANGVTEYTYDTSNRMLTLKDPRNIVYLTNEYDSAGRVTKQTQADNSTYQIAYTLDANGKVTQTDVTDPRGKIRRVTFNADGYTLSETRALGLTEQQTYVYERQSGTNLISSITDALSRLTSLTYDGMANLESLTRLSGTPEAVTTTLTHEPAFNQISSVTDPLNHMTALAYDGKGNLISVSDPLNHQTTLTYNLAGQPLTVTDALQHTNQLTYDSGELVAIADPLGRTATRRADALGRTTTVANPLGQETRYEYDALSRQTRGTDPLQSAMAFAYDPNGNLLSVTDARNGVKSYIYNNMDRATTRRDPLLHDDTYQYDPNGNLTQITDRKSQVTTYGYDPLNRQTLITYPDLSITSLTYDGGNRLTQAVHSVSGTITFAYDNLDRLTSKTTPQGTISYSYDAAGRRTSMTVAGQTSVNYTYDNADRLTQVTQGSATVTISYDNVDRRTSLTLPSGLVTEYAYDSASQLTGITYKYGANTLGNLTYAHDDAGRRTSIGGTYARSGLPPAVSSASHNSANQQTAFGSQTLSYDLNGNLTSDGTNTYVWNGRNQLVSMTGPGLTASFQYDAFGKRISKTVNGATTTYLYDGANLVQEQSGGSPSANILAGGLDEVFTRTDAGGAWSPLFDGLGSTLALADSSGTVQTQYTYEPFGKTTTSGSSNGNSSQYTGRENDGTGLYFYRSRYYSPALQRFISEDPIGLAGGINLYGYVVNNSINFRDPFGLKPNNPNDLDSDGSDIVNALKDFVRSVKDTIRDVIIAGAVGEVVGAAVININPKGLNHVLDGHVPGGANTAGKSLFSAGEDVAALIKQAESIAPVKQTGGNLERIVDAGRTIGIDRVSGQPTSIYTVITTPAGTLKTAFPGIP